jgi:hypothetical protein
MSAEPRPPTGVLRRTLATALAAAAVGGTIDAALAAAVPWAEARFVLLGWALAAVQGVPAALLARLAIGPDSTRFVVVGVAGQTLRVTLFALVLFLLARFLPGHTASILLGAMPAYFVLLFAEVADLHLQSTRP